MTTLPTDSQERKNIPMNDGLLKYFPAALAGVSRISKIGNDKHNPGEPMHHARGKSSDHADCIIRHLMDVNDLITTCYRNDFGAADTKLAEAILLEVSQLAWRALALSQELHEKYGGAPLAPGAKLPAPEQKTLEEAQQSVGLLQPIKATSLGMTVIQCSFCGGTHYSWPDYYTCYSEKQR